MARSEVTTAKIDDAATRRAALAVLDEVFRSEKRWIDDPADEIPTTLPDDISWFVAWLDGEPAGVIRLHYDPLLELPAEAEFSLDPEIDVARLVQGKRFVEIGRFAIVPRHRRNYRIALRLMGAAAGEVVGRGYTHFITDVFEDDPHSPYRFHVRVLGFERIGTHRFGELKCDSMRIILVLDIARAYVRLREKKSRVYQEMTQGVTDLLDAFVARRKRA